MSWIKENKVAASIIGVTVVLSGALAYLGKSANADAEVARQKEKAAVSKIDTLQAAQPYPNKENKEIFADNLASFAADTKAFQESILTYRPENMPKLTPNEFSAEVSRYINKLNRYYKAKNIENKGAGNAAYGMEKYISTMAKERSTRYLDYNRKALEWLFVSLADSGIESLNNVYREPVAEEMVDAPKIEPNPRARTRGRAAKKVPEALTSVYDGLPIQITFTGTEASLQEFVTKITNEDEFFFTINFLKIMNNEQDPVTISKAAFPPDATPPAPVDPVDPLNPAAEGATPAPDEAPATSDDSVFDFGEAFPDLANGALQSKEIIKQVIGDEKITVFMHLELVLFKEASKVAIPGLIPEKADKEPAKEGTPK